MSIRLNSYISFRDNTQEAMDFYQSIFGGKVYSDTFRSYKSDQMSVADEDLDKIMHAYLKADYGIELMAADTPTGMEYHEGSRITLTLNGDDEERLRGYWNALSESGVVSVPLEKAPWGDTFGMVTDKFGVNWMVDIGPEDPRIQ